MENKYQHYFFFGLLLIALVLTTFIFLPYLTAIVLAIVFSVIFRPVYRLISRILVKGKESSSVAAFLTIIIVAIVVITPLSFLGLRISTEGQHVYTYLTDEEEHTKIVNTLNDGALFISEKFLGYYPDIAVENFDIAKYAQNLLQWSFTNIDTIFSSAAMVAINLFILLFAMFYMLRDGGALKRQIVLLSPLRNEYDEEVLHRLVQVIRSVVSGSLAVALLQGFFAGIGFYIFGIPNPVLWGTVTVVSALVPGIGTALILIPGIAYLFLTGTTTQAVGLLIWGVVIVSTIDNLIGPSLMHRGLKVHQFLIFLSVMGGLAFFGAIGFILGPLIVAFLIALLDIYKKQTLAVLN